MSFGPDMALGAGARDIGCFAAIIAILVLIIGILLIT